jgi:hypothetical protein
MPAVLCACPNMQTVIACVCCAAAVQQADLDDLRGLLENVIQERDAALTEVCCAAIDL